MSYITRIKEDIDKHSQRYLWGSIVVFILLFSFLVLKKYYYFGYNIADLAIFNQTFWNTINGRWFEETITLNNYFADHFSPILVLLLPFYALKQSAATLLLIQVVVTALCAWPLFLIAKRLSKNNLFSFLVSFLWLVNPMVHHQLMYEFHFFHLMVFLFFWSFYFYQENKIKYFFIFYFLALLTREDAAFLFIGLSFLFLLEKRSRKIFFSIFTFSILYFIVAILFIKSKSPVESYKFLDYYNWLGGESFFRIIFMWLTNPIAVLLHILSPKNIFIFLYFSLFFLFVPFLAKKYLLLTVLPFLQFMMTNGGLSVNHIYTHYSMIFLAGFFIAYIFGLWKIFDRKINNKLFFIYSNKIFFITIFIFSVIFFLFFTSPILNVAKKKFLPQYHENRMGFIQQIPEGSAVCTDPSLMSELSKRQKIYNIDYVYYGKSSFAEWDFTLPEVDYIFLDMSQFLITLSDRNSLYLQKNAKPLLMPDNWARTLTAYDLVKAQDNLFLWAHKNQNNQNILKYFQQTSIDLEDDNFIKDWSIHDFENQRILAIAYNNLDSNNYIIRFHQGGLSWDAPFDYGLYSLAQKKAGKTFTAYYYINNQVDVFELYRYDSVKTLGEMDNVALFDKKEKVFGPVNLISQ